MDHLSHDLATLARTTLQTPNHMDLLIQFVSVVFEGLKYKQAFELTAHCT